LTCDDLKQQCVAAATALTTVRSDSDSVHTATVAERIRLLCGDSVVGGGVCQDFIACVEGALRTAGCEDDPVLARGMVSHRGQCAQAEKTRGKCSDGDLARAQAARCDGK
jgi:hypothetical protein